MGGKRFKSLVLIKNFFISLVTIPHINFCKWKRNYVKTLCVSIQLALIYFFLHRKDGKGYGLGRFWDDSSRYKKLEAVCEDFYSVWIYFVSKLTIYYHFIDKSSALIPILIQEAIMLRSQWYGSGSQYEIEQEFVCNEKKIGSLKFWWRKI